MSNDRSARLTLLHFVNARSANVGNGALTFGLETTVTQDLPHAVEWSRLAWDDYTFGLKRFDRDFVKMVNTSSDALIVGGAVTMNGQPHYPATGMRFDLPPALWGELERPVVFYGLSHRHWAGQTYHHAKALKDALKRICDTPSMLLALRNDGTRQWLERTFGVDTTEMDVVPDPAVFVPADARNEYPEISDGQRNVILSFNDEDALFRYGGGENRAAVLRGMASAVGRMLERWDDINLILVPHYFDDHRMLADFIVASRPQLAHQRMISVGSARLNGTAHFYGRYARADLVISMRVHSMSPCIGLGVPMIPLVTQDRMVDFLADAGLADLAVDALAIELEERLFEAIERVLNAPDQIRQRFAGAQKELRERTREFNMKVAAHVGA